MYGSQEKGGSRESGIAGDCNANSSMLGAPLRGAPHDS